LGVIDSLSAGYRFLARHLELLLIPVVLDLAIWWAPRLSVAGIFYQVADFYRQTATLAELPSDMSALAEQVADLLQMAGEESNLLTLLWWTGGWLLHLPSLTEQLNTTAAMATIVISRWSSALGLSLLFLFLGLVVGVVYLLLLARNLPIGAADKQWAWRQLPKRTMRHALQLVALIGLFVGALMAIFLPVSVGIALVGMILPGITVVLSFLLSGLTMVLVLYLYFVPVGLILDNLRLRQAIAQSFRLVRDNFWATLGLILLSGLIMTGFQVILVRLVTYQPLGTLIAILVNAFIGSGLAMGLMIFYRSRVLLAQGETLPVEL
jgi:hypothetical protein